MDGKLRVHFLHGAIYVERTFIARPTYDEVTNISLKKVLVMNFMLLLSLFN